MFNTEYVIIPVCIPDNDNDYIKVSNIPFSIWHYDDETGRLIDTVQAQHNALKRAAEIYNWSGKLDYANGIGTAGGIGDKKAAEKSNEKLIERLKQCTRIDFIRGAYISQRY